MPDPTPPGNAAGAPASPKDPENQQAIVALVFGIVGIMGCQILAPIALFLGWAYTRDAKARGYEPDPMGMVALILGMVGTVLLLFQFLVLGGVFLMYGVICCCSFGSILVNGG